MASAGVAASLSFRCRIRCTRAASTPASVAAADGATKVSEPARAPKRGEVLEVACVDLAFKGQGVCRADGSSLVLLCDRALPGERFVGRVTRKKSAYAEVKKLKTLEPHNDFVNAPCEYASSCGGCRTQNLAYSAQLSYKAKQVRELLVTIGKFDAQELDHDNVLQRIVPCADLFHYRNKMEFSFGSKRWVSPFENADGEKDNLGYPVLGLHVPGFFDKVIQIETCLLQSEAANKLLALIQECWVEPALQLSPYDVHKHTGFLKHLMIRTGSNITTGATELMVNFVTSCYKPELLEPLVTKIRALPEVVSVVNNVNSSVGNTSVGEEEYILHGRSTITEKLRGLTFQISANSFFQTSTKQADVLYTLIEECAGLRGDGSEIILDLFCGTGSIGLSLAKRVKHVYGYEVVAEAIEDARRNAELNNIQNATFIQGDLNKISGTFGLEFPKPDIIISDPNRPGMHTKLIKYLLQAKAPKLVYVSCNPSTCARDLDYLCHGLGEPGFGGCYKLKSVQPVDMFPHTPHIECVCSLELCC